MFDTITKYLSLLCILVDVGKIKCKLLNYCVWKSWYTDPSEYYVNQPWDESASLNKHWVAMFIWTLHWPFKYQLDVIWNMNITSSFVLFLTNKTRFLHVPMKGMSFSKINESAPKPSTDFRKTFDLLPNYLKHDLS